MTVSINKCSRLWLYGASERRQIYTVRIVRAVVPVSTLRNAYVERYNLRHRTAALRDGRRGKRNALNELRETREGAPPAPWENGRRRPQPYLARRIAEMAVEAGLDPEEFADDDV